jgi:hypothetical protein
MGGRGEGGELVRTDAPMSARTHVRVRADAYFFTPSNFKKDATVHPSHGRLGGHRPTLRPSVRKHPRDNPACKWMLM